MFDVRTAVARDCTRGLYGHRKESLHWKLTLGEKSVATPGTRTRVGIAPGPSSPTLYQLNYTDLDCVPF